MPMPDFTLFHDPSSATSRDVWALLRHAGVEPAVVARATPPPMTRHGAPAGSAMALDMGLGPHAASGDGPVVATPWGTRQCRSAGDVLSLLPPGRLAPFTQEDGVVAVDTGARDAVGVTMNAAQAGDWEAVAALLAAAGLPEAGAREHLSGFQVARFSGRVIGVAGLEVHGSWGVLRSVAIASDWRGRSVGRGLVEVQVARARSLGWVGLALLTSDAAPYFQRMGFQAADRSAADPALQASALFRGACPASATYLVKDLAAGH